MFPPTKKFPTNKNNFPTYKWIQKKTSLTRVPQQSFRCLDSGSILSKRPLLSKSPLCKLFKRPLSKHQKGHLGPPVGSSFPFFGANVGHRSFGAPVGNSFFRFWVQNHFGRYKNYFGCWENNFGKQVRKLFWQVGKLFCQAGIHMMSDEAINKKVNGDFWLHRNVWDVCWDQITFLLDPSNFLYYLQMSCSGNGRANRILSEYKRILIQIYLQNTDPIFLQTLIQTYLQNAGNCQETIIHIHYLKPYSFKCEFRTECTFSGSLKRRHQIFFPVCREENCDVGIL